MTKKFHMILPGEEHCLFCGLTHEEAAREPTEKGCTGEDLNKERLKAWVISQGITPEHLDLVASEILEMHHDLLGSTRPMTDEEAAEYRRTQLRQPRPN